MGASPTYIACLVCHVAQSTRCDLTRATRLLPEVGAWREYDARRITNINGKPCHGPNIRVIGQYNGQEIIRISRHWSMKKRVKLDLKGCEEALRVISAHAPAMKHWLNLVPNGDFDSCAAGIAMLS